MIFFSFFPCFLFVGTALKNLFLLSVDPFLFHWAFISEHLLNMAAFLSVAQINRNNTEMCAWVLDVKDQILVWHWPEIRVYVISIWYFCFSIKNKEIQCISKNVLNFMMQTNETKNGFESNSTWWNKSKPHANLQNHTSSHAVKHIKSDVKQKVKYSHTSEQCEKKGHVIIILLGYWGYFE